MLLVSCFIILVIVLAMLGNQDEGRNIVYVVPEYNNPDCGEVQVIEYPDITTYRSWLEYRGLDFCVSYRTDEYSYETSNSLRHSFSSYENDSDRFWRDVYRHLFNTDFGRVQELADSLYEIGVKKELNRNEFANMVVSFVQDIPYSYVLVNEDCDDQEPPYMECLEDEFLGILSPIEFLHTLVGDCDTRTVLLYTLFKHYDYHPMIVNSWVHSHSMFALDVQAPGDYIEHRGRHYYFWETTATNWQAGEIPPTFSSDRDSWHIILD